MEYCVLDDASTAGCINTANIGINNGKWHHIVALQESKSLRKLYVDGIQRAIDTTTVGTLTPDAATIGALRFSGTTGYYFKGSLDDLRIYNRALSTLEVQALYNSRTGDIQHPGAPTNFTLINP
jgi:hypothetical protein